MSFRLVVIRIPMKRRAEKFFRKLAGMADLEDALKKLDRLTQEEARMANAEVMRIAHSIRDEVKVVDGKVEEVCDKVRDVGETVEDVGDKVEDVGNKVEDVGNKVEDIGDQVQYIDDKVQVVIEGSERHSINGKTLLTHILSDGIQAREVAKDLGDKVQVVIDGARGLFGRLSSSSNIFTFRRQTSESSGEGHR